MSQEDKEMIIEADEEDEPEEEEDPEEEVIDDDSESQQSVRAADLPFVFCINDLPAACDSSAHEQHPQRDITLQQSWRLYWKMKKKMKMMRRRC